MTGGELILLNMPFPRPNAGANLQGDGKLFIDVMTDAGATISPYIPSKVSDGIFEWLKRNWLQPRPAPTIVASARPSEKYGGVTVTYANIKKVKVNSGKKRFRIHEKANRGKAVVREFREFSDTFLTFAAIAPLLTGCTRILGVGHTRKQETNRIEAMATELRRLVGNESIVKGEDFLEIRAASIASLKKRIKGRHPVAINTYNDHRVAMSFAILGCYDLLGNGQPWLSIKDPLCCAKTFPSFFEVLERIRVDSHEEL
jgi:5-enolpyruvylshikimate-3-phosphate synthase